MIKLESYGVLHTYAHIFTLEELYQEKPYVVVAIMPQISLKTVLKEWGYQSHSSSKS